MKINAKYFDLINKEPRMVQKTKKGDVEIHSLNDYPQLYNSNIAKCQFTFWSNNGTTTYKLLIEDSFYDVMKDLYSEEVNGIWLEFYEEVTLARKNAVIKGLIPMSAIVFASIAALGFIPEEYSAVGNYVGVGLIAVFLVVNVLRNKKINEKMKTMNIAAIDKIKKAVTETHFDELLDNQEVFVEEFYNKQRKELGIEDNVEDKPIEINDSNEEKEGDSNE